MDDDDDIHMCLVCNKTITGILNYINHKKNECAGKKTPKKTASSASYLPDAAPYTTSVGATVESLRTNVAQSFDGHNVFLEQGYNSGQSVSYGDSNLLSDQSGFLTNDGLHASAPNFSTTTFPDATVDFQKMLSCTTNSEKELLSSQISLAVYANNHSTDATQLTCSLSPIFSTAPSVKTDEHDDDVDASMGLHEDHGLMNAIIKDPRRRHKPKLSASCSPDGLMSSTLHYDNHYAGGKFSGTKKEDSGEKEVIDDFFQSLELMSKSDPRAEKGQLPISNILNNLTFSSDEEDLGFTFGDDVSFDSLTEDSADDMVPPRHHTGGKWKPGDKQLTAYKKPGRPPSTGKWPPGEGPMHRNTVRRSGPSHRGKNIALIKGLEPHKRGKGRPKGAKKGKRSLPAPSSKQLTCNFCNMSFNNRFKYSNHCRSASHKAKVFDTKTDEDSSKLDESTIVSHEFLANDVADGNHSELARTENDFETTESDDKAVNDESVGNSEKETDMVACDAAEKEENDTVDVVGDHDDEEENNSENEKVTEQDGNTSQTDSKGDGGQQAESTAYAPEVLVAIHICTVCDKKYPNKYLVSKHLLSKYHRNRAVARQKEHFEMLEKYNKCIVRFSPYQCSICRFYFNKNDDFIAHVQSEKHREKCSELVGQMMCTMCKFRSHEHEGMQNHLESTEHTGEVKKYNKICILKECHVKSECKYCGVVMRSFTRLMRHVRLKHADGKKVESRKVVRGQRNHPICNYCSKQFDCHTALDLHVKRKHTFERNHSCIPCNKSFSDKYTLSLHKRSLSHNNRLTNFNKKEINSFEGQDLKAEVPINDNPEIPVLKDETSESSFQLKYGGEAVPPEGVDSQYGGAAVPPVEVGSQTKYGKAAVPSMGVDDATRMLQFAEQEATDVSAVNKGVQAASGSETECENYDADDVDYRPSEEIGAARKPKSPGKSKPRKKYTRKTRKYPPHSSFMKKNFKCNHCDFTVTKYEDLRPHYLEQHSKKIKLCEPCDMIFLSEKALKLHWNSKGHQTNIGGFAAKQDTQLYECHVCKRKYADENYRNFHTAYQHFHATTDKEAIEINGGKSETITKYHAFVKEIEQLHHKVNVTCPECGLSILRSNVMAHLRLHTQEKLFKCRICDKGFLSNFALRKHLLFHFGCTEKTCDVCGREFKMLSAFEKHMQIHRAESKNNGKTFVCETCGMAFFLDAQLKRHRTRHMEKNFKCTFPGCHWKFVLRGELNAHARIHEAKKPYLCDTCGFSAFTKYHLKRHNKVHTGERKFHCDYCTYKAGNNTHLQRHMRIHIGSKPFKCPYCSYACNTHENIRKHIVETKKHEGKKIYPCKFCDYSTNSCKEFRAHLVTLHEDVIGKDFSVISLSVYTGLYRKEEDLKQPEEGMKIIPLKERKNTRRKKQDSDDEIEKLSGDHIYSQLNIQVYNDDGMPMAFKTEQTTDSAKLVKKAHKHSRKRPTSKMDPLWTPGPKKAHLITTYSKTFNDGSMLNTNSVGYATEASSRHDPADEQDREQCRAGPIPLILTKHGDPVGYPPINFSPIDGASAVNLTSMSSANPIFHAGGQQHYVAVGNANTVETFMTAPNFAKLHGDSMVQYHDYSARLGNTVRAQGAPDNGDRLIIDMNNPNIANL